MLLAAASCRGVGSSLAPHAVFSSLHCCSLVKFCPAVCVPVWLQVRQRQQEEEPQHRRPATGAGQALQPAPAAAAAWPPGATSRRLRGRVWRAHCASASTRARAQLTQRCMCCAAANSRPQYLRSCRCVPFLPAAHVWCGHKHRQGMLRMHVAHLLSLEHLRPRCRWWHCC